MRQAPNYKFSSWKLWKQRILDDHGGVWPKPEEWYNFFPTCIEEFVQKDFELFGHKSHAEIENLFQEWIDADGLVAKDRIEKSCPPGWKWVWKQCKDKWNKQRNRASGKLRDEENTRKRELYKEKLEEKGKIVIPYGEQENPKRKKKKQDVVEVDSE